ncbi:acyl-CoA thioesterase [Sediminibacterium soli]|uniref:acyl-CoA thioesterase n=1 Tax=Sediminibacterium soli TaxID=2698829 RepID=UPI00137A6DA0|nr:thioesterase family protein [Sediminibacterium soli]NCI46179.1 acyl-CoA thioesterase [Sediminibacterium soli]
MYEHISRIRVRYAETDQMDIVYYGNYAQYFEVGRAECIRELGFTYKKMEEMGVRMPVVHMEARFLRPAHYDDLISVKTLLKELPAGHEISFHHEVYNEAGKLLTTGNVTLYFIDSHTGKRTVMPPELRDALGVFFG